MMNKIIYLLILTFVICNNVIGYFMGPTIDRSLINDEQFTSFRECHSAAVKINEALNANKSLFNVPPRSITEKDVSFLLYTWKNLRNPQVLPMDADQILSSNFNISKETILYVHPFFEPFVIGAFYFDKLLLSRKDINFIITNWNSYSYYDIMYSRNITTPLLGKIIAKFVQTLISIGADSKTIHLMGFSAGAQAIGLAGKIISPKVGRISAYDPQGNCYNFLPADQRISILDADYVLIVHCTVGVSGMPLNITGNATFYMNGGLLQPYCQYLPTIPLMVQCSHTSCEFYLYQSLEANSTLKGYKCSSHEDYLNNNCNVNDVVTLTYDISTNITGLYFVDTVSTVH